MDMESTSGPTTASTKVTGRRIRSLATASTHGLMAELIADSGKITTCMAKVSTPGLTEGGMKETT